jgi:hypothetical protein
VRRLAVAAVAVAVVARVERKRNPGGSSRSTVAPGFAPLNPGYALPGIAPS